jgi:short-subunit dehydrogenase
MVIVRQLLKERQMRLRVSLYQPFFAHCNGRAIVAIQLKPLNDQVIVITGASSGIGLATAELAAERGANVVLAARSGGALSAIAARLARNNNTLAVECDVAVYEGVERVAEAAVARFGRIDTWVNNAAQGIYGRLDEVSLEDARLVFDVNFWGLVHGSLIALPYLKADGGALINVGSEVSEASAPLLGVYVASKHAVKGFTDCLRLEIEEVDEAPVSITLIEPTAVDTPFPQHARNYMDREPMLPKPRIEATDVANAILDAAVIPTRLKRVGMMSTINTAVSKTMPGVADKLAARRVDQQQYNEPPRNPQGILRQPSEAIAVVGQTRGGGGREPA